MTSRLYTFRGGLPLWLALAVALPLGALLLTSLLLAVLVVVAGAGVAALLLPNRRTAPRGRGDDGSIELDQSQYRHLDDRRPPR
jgi:hypothetical protein